MGTMSEKICQFCKATWTVDSDWCPECMDKHSIASYPIGTSQIEAASIETTSEMIVRAFDSVELGDGLTIHEADLEGQYYDGRREAARSQDPERRWTDIPDWKFERIHALCFFDVQGWKFHLPGYMCWALKNWKQSKSISSECLIWGLKWDGFEQTSQRFESLNSEQCLAVLAFLEHMDKFSGDPDASISIESYWKRFRNAASI